MQLKLILENFQFFTFITGQIKSSFGWTALHMAIHSEHHEIMEALITVRCTNKSGHLVCWQLRISKIMPSYFLTHKEQYK